MSYDEIDGDVRNHFGDDEITPATHEVGKREHLVAQAIPHLAFRSGAAMFTDYGTTETHMIHVMIRGTIISLPDALHMHEVHLNPVPLLPPPTCAVSEPSSLPLARIDNQDPCYVIDNSTAPLTDDEALSGYTSHTPSVPYEITCVSHSPRIPGERSAPQAPVESEPNPCPVGDCMAQISCRISAALLSSNGTGATTQVIFMRSSTTTLTQSLRFVLIRFLTRFESICGLACYVSLLQKEDHVFTCQIPGTVTRKHGICRSPWRCCWRRQVEQRC